MVPAERGLKFRLWSRFSSGGQGFLKAIMRDKNKDSSDQFHHPSRHQIDERPVSDSLAAQNYAEEKEHRTKENIFWDRQIRITKWLNWITAFAGIVAVGGLAALYKSIGDAEFATVRANRAWLVVTNPSAQLRNDGGVEEIAPFLQIINVGNEPAMDLSIYIRSFWIAPGYILDRSGSRRFDAEKFTFVDNDTCGDTDRGIKVDVLWHKDVPTIVNANFERTKPGFDSGTDIYVVQACVYYKTFRTIHYTRVCYFDAVETPGQQAKTQKWSRCQGEGQQWAN